MLIETRSFFLQYGFFEILNFPEFPFRADGVVFEQTGQRGEKIIADLPGWY